jgi:hypothetical protein
METEIMLTVIFVLLGSTFGSVLGLMYKVDKLQKSVDAVKSPLATNQG